MRKREGEREKEWVCVCVYQKRVPNECKNINPPSEWEDSVRYSKKEEEKGERNYSIWHSKLRDNNNSSTNDRNKRKIVKYSNARMRADIKFHALFDKTDHTSHTHTHTHARWTIEQTTTRRWSMQEKHVAALTMLSTAHRQRAKCDMTHLIGEMKNLWHLLKVICPRSEHERKKNRSDCSRRRGGEASKENCPLLIRMHLWSVAVCHLLFVWSY